MKRTLYSTLFTFFFFTHFLAAQNIIFQEEFALGIPNTWTNNAIQPNNPDLKWQWSVDGEAPDGAWWLDRPALFSPSIANGCAYFDSDYYQTGGTAADWGNGPIPGPHTVELVSPVIDCSNASNLILKFHQYFRPFQAEGYVSVSGDGGLSWTDFDVNAGIGANVATEHYNVRFADISAIADGSANVQVKFVFSGTAYIWLIDDVVVAEKPTDQLDLPVSVRPPFYGIPKSQLGSYALGGAVCNEWGTDAQPDVTYNMNWLDENGDIVHGDQAVLPADLPTDSCEIMLFDTDFDATVLPEGTYTLSSNVTSSNPNAFNSDFYLDEFVVTDSTFQKDHTYLTEGATGANSTPWQIGYDFPIINGGYSVYNIEAAFSGNIDNVTVLVRLYEILNSDFGSLVFDELKIVGIGFVGLTTGDTYQLANFEMTDWDTGDPGVALEAGKQYLVTAGVEDSPNVFLAMGYDIDYSLSGWSSHMAILGEDLFTSGFGEMRYAPVIRVHLRGQPSAANDLNANIGSLKLSPNPAADFTQLQVDLKEKAQQVDVRLMDVAGQLLQQWQYDKLQEFNVPISTEGLVNGVYMVEVRTERGRKTVRLNVVK